MEKYNVEDFTIRDLIDMKIFSVISREAFHKRIHVEWSEECDFNTYTLLLDPVRNHPRIVFRTKTMASVFDYDFFDVARESLRNRISRAWLVKSTKMNVPLLVFATKEGHRAALAPLQGPNIFNDYTGDKCEDCEDCEDCEAVFTASCIFTPSPDGCDNIEKDT